ncbi:hypothetical protein LCGC14_1676300, partial [marine sediment metagenome]
AIDRAIMAGTKWVGGEAKRHFSSTSAGRDLYR